VPTRQKEINQLRGDVVEDSESEESEEEEEVAPIKPVAPVVAKGKGDADSSSDEEESGDEKRKKQAKHAKLKKDLQKEQEELGKILMTKKQRQLFEQADKSTKAKKDVAAKLKQKRKALEKAR